MTTLSLDDRKRAYYGTLLGYSGAQLATKSVSDLEKQFFDSPPASGGLVDGDYGDVTVSGSGTIINLDPGAVQAADLAADAATQAELDAIKTDQITFVVDGAGSAITTGAKKVYVQIPYACTITSWVIIGDPSGSIVFDIWKDTYANFPPTVADTITASAKPTLTTAVKATSSTLTGWTTSIAAGDVLELNVDSATTVTKAILILKVTRV